MKTTTKKYVQTEQMAQECKPIPCDIPEFCRNNYFTGKLLTERDLTAEQRYLTDKLRLHHVALHGWGVICGLKVRSHPHCPDRRAIVEPGLAVDSCGRFIRVLTEIEVELPKTTARPTDYKDRYGEEEREYQRSRGGYEAPSDGAEKQRDYGTPQQERDYGTPQGGSFYPPYEQSEQPGYGGYHHNPEPTVNLYFCLAYAESERELTPAPFDECACGESGQKANRICEISKVIVETDEPEGWDELPDRHHCEEDDCLKLLDALIDPCPLPAKLKCVPLAIVNDFVVGDALTEDKIDNSIRVTLRSTQYLEQIICCLAKKITTQNLTRIVDVSWDHQGEYNCRDFMGEFIGEDKGFQIVFEGPVTGITPRTFQAIAVRYVDPSGAGLMEVVPAIVRQSIDRTKARLQIDPRYAQRRLDHTRFDLYIKLRAGHILDDNGLAVDGDLLARPDADGKYSVPIHTGDGVPGGVFESWIKVSP
ncbi:MAG: hypothetical protein ABR594_17105 [Pyrinomonadaceae bacterium]